MSNLLPEKWSEALERVHDKVGHFLNSLVPWKKQDVDRLAVLTHLSAEVDPPK
jgi:hypothetical protein